MNEQTEFRRLLDIIQRLRSPQGGCPWDLKQKKEDLGRYLIEEAYELIDAIEAGDPAGQREEMGDLLFQILFLARIAEEKGEFGVPDVLKEIGDKMIRRHPHVFGSGKADTVDEVKSNWERIKQEQENKKPEGALSSLPRSLPSLLKAQIITEKAARLGFDWPHIQGVIMKVEEEVGELKASVSAGDPAAVKGEIGDLLFSIVNLSRFAGVNADDSLKGAIDKFLRRFSYIEKKLAEKGHSSRSGLPGGDGPALGRVEREGITAHEILSVCHRHGIHPGGPSLFQLSA